jgi:hypothetical protein
LSYSQGDHSLILCTNRQNASPEIHVSVKGGGNVAVNHAR